MAVESGESIQKADSRDVLKLTHADGLWMLGEFHALAHDYAARKREHSNAEARRMLSQPVK